VETTGSRFSSPRVQRRLLWLSALVLAAGIAAVLIVFFRDTGSSLATPKTNEPVDIVKPTKQVPLEKEARQVAGRFILTAVLREHLDEAWKLAGPAMKQGISYKQWLTGNIPVVPYTYKLDLAPLKIDTSTKNHALLEVALLAKNKKLRPQFFFIELDKIGKGAKAHWVVSAWVPRGRPAVPANPNN
jgi:hypothetical protein